MGKKQKVCYMDTESFISVYIKTNNIYKDVAEDVETRFDTSNYKLDKSLHIGLMKDKLGAKIMTKLVGFRAKTYSYLIDNGNENKKAKDTKRFVIKGKLNFENYKNFLEATQLDNKFNYLEKNKTNIDSLKKDHKESI